MKVCANFIVWSEAGADLSTSEILEPNAPDTRVRTVQFAHATVEDYLESRLEEEYTKKSTHGHVAESCLFYLKDIDRERALEAREERGFLNYALAYWPYHVSEACANGYDISIAEISNNFTDQVFEEWISVLLPIARNLSQDPITQEKLLDCISLPADRIFLACAWDICDLVNVVVDMRVAAGSWEDSDRNQTNTNQATPLYLASKYGYPKIVELLVDSGADINVECKKQDGALEVASSRGHSKIVKYLLDMGGKVSAHGGEAIRLAASKGHNEILKLLVINFEEELKNGHVPLHNFSGSRSNENGENPDLGNTAQKVFSDAMKEGAKSGKGEVIKTLLAQKQCFGLNDKLLAEAMKDALIHAVDVGSDTVTNRLLEAGANPNFRDEEGASPLDIAACNGHFAVVKSLLPKIRDLADYGQSALSLAAEYDHYTIVKLLLERGVTLHFSQPKDIEILRKAVDKNYSELIKLLLAHSREETYGISLNEAAESGDESVVDLLLLLGATAEHTQLQEQAMDDHFSAIQHLLDHDAERPQGPSSLQKAAAAGHELIVSLLLKHKAPIDLRPNEDSALHKAVINNHPSIVEILLNHHANVNDPGSSGTPLLLAAKFGYQQIVDLLLKRGANIDAENENGTALEIAARRGHFEIVESLILEHGSTKDPVHGLTPKERLNRKGPQGTPLQCAAAGGYREIAELLIAQGADVNVQSGPYGTALQAAVAEGRVDMVKMLCSARATDFSITGEMRWDRATSAWITNEHPYTPEPRTPGLPNGNNFQTTPPPTPPPIWYHETLLLCIHGDCELDFPELNSNAVKRRAESIDSKNSTGKKIVGVVEKFVARPFAVITIDSERRS
ncbi:multiple ankyrin repeats single kh domain protein [Rutstroemia sp. NJR-2017a BBW]|nr:multiple ankyrin repeats single kh domain protein [Rutstroemia sp. NJR-2017a BBW]